jgi:hypothetical protein
MKRRRSRRRNVSADGIAAGAVFAFFYDRTRAFAGIATVRVELLEGGVEDPPDSWVRLLFGPPLPIGRSPLEF